MIQTPKREEWNLYEAMISFVPADVLCMCHCVNAAKDVTWMKTRHRNGMAVHTSRDKADEARAQNLKRQFIQYLTTKGRTDVAKRSEIVRSAGYPSTDELPYLAEMLGK